MKKFVGGGLWLVGGIFAVGWVLMLAGCETLVVPKSPAPCPFSALSRDRQEVYEVVLRRMFSNWQAHDFDEGDWFYVAIEGYDAPEDLLARFRAEGYVVRRGSDFRHRRGIVCEAMIHSISASGGTVDCRQTFGTLGADARRYTLRKRAGKWEIVHWKWVASFPGSGEKIEWPPKLKGTTPPPAFFP